MSEDDPMIKWLVEVVHYPFDFQFDPPPPVDHWRIAQHWREWDNWLGVTPEDAHNCVMAEAGLL